MKHFCACTAWIGSHLWEGSLFSGLFQPWIKAETEAARGSHKESPQYFLLKAGVSAFIDRSTLFTSISVHPNCHDLPHEWLLIYLRKQHYRLCWFAWTQLSPRDVHWDLLTRLMSPKSGKTVGEMNYSSCSVNLFYTTLGYAIVVSYLYHANGWKREVLHPAIRRTENVIHLLFLFRQQEQLQRNWNTVTSHDTYFHSAYSDFNVFIYIEVQNGSGKILKHTLSSLSYVSFSRLFFSSMKKFGTLKNKQTNKKTWQAVTLHLSALLEINRFTLETYGSKLYSEVYNS